MSTTQTQSKKSLHELGANDRSNVPAVITEVESAITDLGLWLQTAQSNERTNLCIWDGQSEDGRKWSSRTGKAVFPWEGAADTRIPLSDAVVDELTRVQMMAFSMAELSAMGMEATDGEAASRVQTLLKYEVKQRLLSELWAEMNFAVQWKETFGHSLVHVGWHRSYGTAKETLTEEQLVAMLAEAGLMEMDPALAEDPQTQAQIVDVAWQTVLDELESKNQDGQVVALLAERYPLLSEKRMRQVLKDLRAEGVAEFRNPYELPGRPCVRALMPGIDVIYPWWTGDIKRAPWVAVVERFSEPELRGKVLTEGWNEAFVEALLEPGPHRIVDVGSLVKNAGVMVDKVFNRGGLERFRSYTQTACEDGAYEVLRVHVQTVDADGFPALQEIVMHPDLSGQEARDRGEALVGLDKLVEHWFEGGSFVDFRREYKSRPLWDVRGVPELVKTAQAEVKTLRDSRMDRTALATLPPLRVAPRRIAGAAGKMDIMPGMKVPTSAGEPNDWMQPPAFDQGNLEMEATVRRDVAQYLGTEHPEVPPTQGQMHRQYIVTGFLIQCREMLVKILQLDQQYMSPLQVSRVMGAGPAPFQVTREEIAGQFDVHLQFDTRQLDMEYVQKRWAALKDAFSIDRSGALQDVPVMRWLLGSIDANLADLALSDMDAKTEQEVNDEKQALANLMLGIEMRPPQNANAQVRLETLKQEVVTNPKVTAQYYADPAFQAAVNARLAKWEFDIQQRGANAQTGRTGWEPTVKPPTAEEELAGGVQS